MLPQCKTYTNWHRLTSALDTLFYPFPTGYRVSVNDGQFWFANDAEITLVALDGIFVEWMSQFFTSKEKEKKKKEKEKVFCTMVPFSRNKKK